MFIFSSPTNQKSPQISLPTKHQLVSQSFQKQLHKKVLSLLNIREELATNLN
jgi:hypothetical protein